MISTLDVDIRPGSGLGPFELGTSLWSTLDLLRTLPHLFPQIDLKYDSQHSPITTPIILHIRPHLDLLFSGVHQRLHTICLRKLRDPNPPVRLRYKDTILSSSASTSSVAPSASSPGKGLDGETGEVLRRLGVSRTFGPTYEGDDLRYPGVWFNFDEDPRLTIPEGLKSPVLSPRSSTSATHAHTKSKSRTSNVGTPPTGTPHGHHPEDRMQEVKRVIVLQKLAGGAEAEAERDALSEVLESPIMYGDIFRAVVKIHNGVTLDFYPQSHSQPVHIQIGVTTAQDLQLDLGPPLRVHYKEDDRMTIHATAPRNAEDESEVDYFYNYFQHGIDILISGGSHIVKKIILHTNIPGTPLFQRYKRCPWEIEGPPEDDEDGISSSNGCIYPVIRLRLIILSRLDHPPRMRFHDRFDVINHFLSPREAPPSMLLDRTDDEPTLTLPNSSTRLVGYDGVILEVTESGHVASVTLF
ncbi:hypothetical protein JAAARDRAFT_75176 [Jaapia argillacea MUCL 33604]|uniref:Uncharacterized protein n=1 Tax=Jaapia argillacea MUCL 33604 TaxID=933084 RepID=A0A067QM49_9AGAM|nr:hypothetical protein JAAARDRAFT_75176 [Jaapia argillacea MUCL 33604]